MTTTLRPAFHLDETGRQVYARYADLALPRHTSYPAVPQWREDWTATDTVDGLAGLGDGRQPLGLYVHLPFCRMLCFYCGCTREIVPDAVRTVHDPVEELLDGLEIEARRAHAVLGRRPLSSVHLGGGTPTFLTPAQLARLWQIIYTHFSVLPGAEIAAEVDPRATTRAHLETLRGVGFNRLSLGVQDFDPVVQRAVNRVQSFDLVRSLVDTARDLGFASLNFDLIYGLPWQTPQTMAETLAKVLALAPDRIAFYRLALLPAMFKWQRAFTPADLPRGVASLDLMLLALERLAAGGYEYIGLDHFAKPDEGLAVARATGDLTRTFQGMTTGRGTAILALGPSAITHSDGFYAQNAKTTKDWRARIERGPATVRGLRLSEDDRIRRDALLDLYAHGRIDGAAFRRRTGRSLGEYFAAAQPAWEVLAAEGLVTVDAAELALTPVLGRLLARVVAVTLDAHAPDDAWRTGLTDGKASAAG